MTHHHDEVDDSDDVQLNYDEPRVPTAPPAPRASFGWWLRLFLVLAWTMACAGLWLAWSAASLSAAAAAGDNGAMSLVVTTGCTGSVWLFGMLALAALVAILR
jgi:hypothetical protein